MLPTKQRRKFKEESAEYRTNSTKLKDEFLMENMTGRQGINCKFIISPYF